MDSPELLKDGYSPKCDTHYTGLTAANKFGRLQESDLWGGKLAAREDDKNVIKLMANCQL
ncbi:hypothetical protein [Castellaniella sp.]|uniref:hypothetical protein n=1 Tax=Castellaniella sp. TaxID=1955812 RepID=UPI002AFE53F7|nr:hypothetical protein [Castellaniella sp.]